MVNWITTKVYILIYLIFDNKIQKFFSQQGFEQFFCKVPTSLLLVEFFGFWDQYPKLLNSICQ